MGKAITPINTPNNNSNFFPIMADQNWKLTEYPIVASVELEEGTAMGIQIVSNTTTGILVAMGAENAAGADFIGLLAEPVTDTDVDYATAGKLKSINVPTSKFAEAVFTVGAGTFTATDVFKTVSFHTGAKSLAVDTAGKGARIVGFTSATVGVCRFDLPTSETA